MIEYIGWFNNLNIRMERYCGFYVREEKRE